MTIDIRAVCTCSLGQLISANISDDYVQGNGVIKTKGSCEIKGTIKPAIGTAVTFTYVKNGVTRQIPRYLLVLSSFADPFRKTTKVELGCRLTYLNDKKEEASVKASDDPSSTFTAEDRTKVVEPVKSSFIASKVVGELGLTVSPGSSINLKNEFTTPKFDLSSGHVKVLGDLLVSENQLGYIDETGKFATRSINYKPNAAQPINVRVLDKERIIDLGPISVGQLPAGEVAVNYESLDLDKASDPKETNKPTIDSNNEDDPSDDSGVWRNSDSSSVFRTLAQNWESSSTVSISRHAISYAKADGSSGTKEYNNITESIESTLFDELTVGDDKTVTVPIRRTVTQRQSASAVLSAMASQRLSNQVQFDNRMVKKITVETFTYDAEGNEIVRIVESYADLPYLYGSAGVTWAFSSTDFVNFDYTKTQSIDRTEIYTQTVGDFQRVETRSYGQWSETIPGQQAIAASNQELTNSTEVLSYLRKVYNGDLYLLSISVATRPRSEGQRIPSPEERIIAGTGAKTAGKAELELTGDGAGAERKLELNLPYAPDDVFRKTATPGVYSVERSEAANRAKEYGETQNNLLMGSRYGMNFQLLPEDLPSYPLDPLAITINGTTALYRVNASTWTLNANGIVAGTDALYTGAVGGTDASWVPVAPGVTLPSAPTVVNGAIVNPAVLPVFNKKTLIESKIRVRLNVQATSLQLAATTEEAFTVRTLLVANKVTEISAPAAAVQLAAPMPTIGTGALVRPPVTTVTIAAPVPSVRFGRVVEVPAVSIGIAAPEIANVGVQRTVVTVPSSAVALAAVVPAIRTGASVAVPAAALTVAAPVPTRVGPPADANFSSVQLLLHLDGTNGSTTFTDSSNNALTVTPFGNAQISTAQSQFGGASALFDGSGDYLIVTEVAGLEPGSGDLTWEMWIRTTNSTQYATLMSRTPASFAFGMWSLMMNHNSSAAGDLALYVANFSTGAPLLLTSGSNVRDGSWHHVAVVRNGSAWALFVDGTSRATNTWSGTIADITGSIYIGRDQFYIRDYTGHIDELRITHGVARYTANFTPPTSAFPS